MIGIQTGKKKILFIISSMVGGGAERVVVEILNNIDRSIYTPYLGLFSKEGPYLKNIKNDIHIHEMSECGTGYKSLFRTAYEFRKLILAVSPDLIVSNLYKVNKAILRANIISNTKLPILVCEHNNLTNTLNKIENKFLRKFANYEIIKLYKRSTGIIAVSNGVKRDLIDNHSLDEKKIAVIHNPVDINKIKLILNDRPRGNTGNRLKQIIAVGRLTMQKGFSDLINAFYLVQKKIPARLTILGEGELRPVLEKQINDLSLDSYVELPGFLDDPWSEIHKSDLFVMSSYWEGFGNVIIEAMTCETPIVSTDCDFGPREIITHGKDGMLTPVGDVKVLCEIIISVLRNQQLGQSLIKNAKEKVTIFDSKLIAKQYEVLFGKVLENNAYKSEQLKKWHLR